MPVGDWDLFQIFRCAVDSEYLGAEIVLVVVYSE
jgi:hypothetical protein